MDDDDHILPPDLDADWLPYLPPGSSDDDKVRPLQSDPERYIPLMTSEPKSPLSRAGWEP
jgi:hypothetical protein